MKIQELIDTLMMKSQYGDLEVGILNKEIECYDNIDFLEKRESNFDKARKKLSDEKRLGKIFIGIN